MIPSLEKFIKKNKVLIIVLGISIFITGILPLIFGLKGMSDFTNWLSATSCVVTMIIALLLYDKLDSKKVAFNKELEAVEDLTSTLLWIQLQFTECNYIEMKSLKLEKFNESVRTGNFYLNWFNIRDKKKWDTQHLKVFFTKSSLELISTAGVKGHNPWIPKNIVDALKPLVITSLQKPFVPENIAEDFILVRLSTDTIDDFIFTYEISYKELSINNFGEFIGHWESILKAIEDWYKSNFDKSPNFEGD